MFEPTVIAGPAGKSESGVKVKVKVLVALALAVIAVAHDTSVFVSTAEQSAA